MGIFAGYIITPVGGNRWLSLWRIHWIIHSTIHSSHLYSYSSFYNLVCFKPAYRNTDSFTATVLLHCYSVAEVCLCWKLFTLTEQKQRKWQHCLKCRLLNINFLFVGLLYKKCCGRAATWDFEEAEVLVLYVFNTYVINGHKIQSSFKTIYAM